MRKLILISVLVIVLMFSHTICKTIVMYHEHRIRGDVIYLNQANYNLNEQLEGYRQIYGPLW